MPAEPQPPVIVLPGITATTLADYYPIEPDEVWTALVKKGYVRIALHPDDVRYEAREPARIMPTNPFGIVYGDLVESLRYELTARADRPTPVFGFGYDWRQDCAQTAAELGQFVDEVLARTALLPHYQPQPPAMVDLVGHSMGGLIIARYLRERQEARAPSRVRRVVTIGSPFRGAIDAIHKLAMGMGLISGLDPAAREREAARTMPAIYELLPTYPSAIDFAQGIPNDIFDMGAWQPSILATLRQFIRLQKAKTTPEQLLTNYLTNARDFVRAVNSLDPARVLPEKADGWLPIVGVDSATHVEVGIDTDERKRPRFDFSAKEVNEWPASDRTGDGTVPFAGACPDFLRRERLVCVTPGDLSFWEVRDRVLIEASGFHGFLPKVNHVQRIVARFLRDDLNWKLEAHVAPRVDPTKRTWPAWLRPKSG